MATTTTESKTLPAVDEPARFFPIVVVTHKRCLDGAAAAARFVTTMKARGCTDDEFLILYRSASSFKKPLNKSIILENPDETKPNTLLYYLDNTPSVEAVVNAYARGVLAVNVLDHHKGNRELFMTLPNSGDVYLYEIRRLDVTGPVSAVGVVAEMMAGPPLTPFERAVQCRDTFCFSDAWTQENRSILYDIVGYDRTVEAIEVWNTYTEDELLAKVAEAAPYVAAMRNTINCEYESRVRLGTIRIAGLPHLRVAYVNTMPWDVTSLGAHLHDLHYGLPAGISAEEALASSDPSLTGKVHALLTVSAVGEDGSSSFRRLCPDIDLTLYAKAKGGNGHPAACGFPDTLTGDELILDDEDRPVA